MAKASTKMKINHSMKAQGIVGTLDLLSSEREDFELNEFARSNKRLYAILSKVLAAHEMAAQEMLGVLLLMGFYVWGLGRFSRYLPAFCAPKIGSFCEQMKKASVDGKKNKQHVKSIKKIDH